MGKVVSHDDYNMQLEIMLPFFFKVTDIFIPFIANLYMISDELYFIVTKNQDNFTIFFSTSRFLMMSLCNQHQNSA